MSDILTMTEKRMTEMEAKLAYQEDTLQTLDDIIYQQQQQIAQLQKTCKHLLDAHSVYI